MEIKKIFDSFDFFYSLIIYAIQEESKSLKKKTRIYLFTSSKFDQKRGITSSNIEIVDLTIEQKVIDNGRPKTDSIVARLHSCIGLFEDHVKACCWCKKGSKVKEKEEKINIKIIKSNQLFIKQEFHNRHWG